MLRYGAASQAAFTVNLSSPSSETVTVDYQTVNGTAVAGSDFTATNGTLVFAPGETERTIIVPTIDDGLIESAETFTVTLSNAVAVPIMLGGDTGTATILDDDTPSSDAFASSEQNVSGTVTGTLAALVDDGGATETITEELYAGNKRSRLEHIWTFTDVAMGDQVELIVDASHNSTVETFEWSYSIDGASWTTLGTVEDGGIFVLPSNLSNTFQIRVTDTDRSRGETTADSLVIDRMLISTTTAAATTSFATEAQTDAEPLDGLASSMAEARHRRGNRAATDAVFATL